MARASRGEIPKNAASKRAASCRKPPSCTELLPERSGSWSYRSGSQPRSAGKPEMASLPSATSRHRSSGEEMPPG
ncbi:hypothetical protein ASD51_34135 [Streptomyces sp. Root55]|nr:hypothetical protein ASD51_34135 [Streptomyces sp. Root55]